jgi:hypothetical protein
MAEIGVPAGLAGLFEPNQAEVAAAKLDRPFLIGAYGLDRIAGRGRVEEMANQTNAIKTLLAMRKMKQDRDKDALHYVSQASVLERQDDPSVGLNQALKAYGIDLPPSVRGFPESVIARNRKPSGSINLGDDTESVVTEGAINAAGERVPVGTPGSTPTTITQKSKRKVGVPGAPPQAAPKAAAPSGPKAGDPVIGPDGKQKIGPNGRPMFWKNAQ